jgi:hypothetical protein
VIAVNDIGKSEESAPLVVLFANKPGATAAPETTNVGDQVVISFTESADDNGADIDGYDVLINTHYDHEWISTSECVYQEDGVDSDRRQIFSCSVSVETLMARPFNLQQGDSVLVKVVAFNRIGKSDESTEGGSARVMTVPDAPTFVATSMVQNGD